jgi:hypothetical protein
MSMWLLVISLQKGTDIFTTQFQKVASDLGTSKDLQRKDGQRQLLCYVSLIRACNKVLYQMVYIGKKVCIP